LPARRSSAALLSSRLLPLLEAPRAAASDSSPIQRLDVTAATVAAAAACAIATCTSDALLPVAPEPLEGPAANAARAAPLGAALSGVESVDDETLADASAEPRYETVDASDEKIGAELLALPVPLSGDVSDAPAAAGAPGFEAAAAAAIAAALPAAAARMCAMTCAGAGMEGWPCEPGRRMSS
jgi:hypothetical protein